MLLVAIGLVIFFGLGGLGVLAATTRWRTYRDGRTRFARDMALIALQANARAPHDAGGSGIPIFDATDATGHRPRHTDAPWSPRTPPPPQPIRGPIGKL